jgi:hypothetical protein
MATPAHERVVARVNDSARMTRGYDVGVVAGSVWLQHAQEACGGHAHVRSEEHHRYAVGATGVAEASSERVCLRSPDAQQGTGLLNGEHHREGINVAEISSGFRHQVVGNTPMSFATQVKKRVRQERIWNRRAAMDTSGSERYAVDKVL